MAATADTSKNTKEAAPAAAAASASTAATTTAAPGWSATFSKVFGKTFVDNKGKQHTDADFKDKKHIAIYFSAHWCPPCRGFTPELVKTYNTMKKTKTDFEFVFVSWDKEAKAFQNYFNDMPWLAVPYADAARRKALNEHYGVEGIPSLVVVDGTTGETITKNGRMSAVFDPNGAEFPWPPKPLEELSPQTIQDINEQATFLLFADDADDKVAEAAVAAVRPLAVDLLAQARKTGNTELTFLYGTSKSHPVAGKIRAFVTAGTAAVVILDIPNRSKYVLAIKASEVTEKAVRDFYAAYKAGTAKREALTPPQQQDDD